MPATHDPNYVLDDSFRNISTIRSHDLHGPYRYHPTRHRAAGRRAQHLQRTHDFSTRSNQEKSNHPAQGQDSGTGISIGQGAHTESRSAQSIAVGSMAAASSPSQPGRAQSEARPPPIVKEQRPSRRTEQTTARPLVAPPHLLLPCVSHSLREKLRCSLQARCFARRHSPCEGLTIGTSRYHILTVKLFSKIRFFKFRSALRIGRIFDQSAPVQF